MLKDDITHQVIDRRMEHSQNTQTLSLFHYSHLLDQTRAELHGVSSIANLFSRIYYTTLFCNRGIATEFFNLFFVCKKSRDRLYIHIYCISYSFLVLCELLMFIDVASKCYTFKFINTFIRGSQWQYSMGHSSLQYSLHQKVLLPVLE